jgi:DNA-binding SARP family transcriptional activator
LAAYSALALVSTSGGAEYEQLAQAMAGETGLRLPDGPARDNGQPSTAMASAPSSAPVAPAASDPQRAAPSAVRIATLGGFAITVNGRLVDLAGLKPRARALLHLLAIHAPRAVHREVLQEALWPDADGPTGARSLQVGISSIRGVLAAATPELGVARDGDAYRLVAPDDAIDLRRLDGLLAHARNGNGRAGADAVGRDQAVLDLLDRELLPEDGPAEWVVERREQLRSAGVAAAVSIARQALAGGDPETAARACRRGLALDKYHDPLWRLLIDADLQAGDAGAASRDRRQYEEVLAGLERETDAAGLSPSRTPRSRRPRPADWLDPTSL